MKQYDGIKGGGDLQQTNSLLQRVYIYIYIYEGGEEKTKTIFYFNITNLLFKRLKY